MPGDSDDWQFDQNEEPDTAVCFAQGKDSLLSFSSPEREVFHSVGLLITECNLAIQYYPLLSIPCYVIDTQKR
ncbi:hypothetical protein BB542_07535 [Escherichia coli]|uniref:Uncharacterized protein n=2 Tax=Enterobacteriaceae TaxID=543 RepID=A0A241QYX3_ECOLX|nr:hypothetical protein BE962_11250 [Escherichia coli]ASF05803.1 hypothetical protein CEQ26_08020 [Escherichia coli O104:H4]AYB97850.1 hypothetical protein CJZ69_11870 [Escherichia coli ATCC 8739]EFN8673674.1 hypothetical protein [Escherichia coli O8]EFO2080926.1 hypothetical protein [Escherichia coli O409]EFO2094627.1 hypothetical protein [Escherichia coli O19]EFO2119933.1 hypothetical protein [Escherichia coli O3]EFO2124089.1 hypothetical protein [Escherichia coli O106]EFO3053316.1 hypoth